MTIIRRVLALAIMGVGLVPFALHPASAQNGPPSDRPGQEEHASDPCAVLPDPSGAAEGIDKACALGGSGGVGRGDFNNDGIADLAVGVPNATVTTVSCAGLSGCTTTDRLRAGTVNVIYGGSGGLTATGNQILSQGRAAATSDAHLGRALAAGRFRGPGFASDLAVGAPGVRSNGAVVGAIYVFFSGSGRLSTTPNQIFRGDQFSTAGTSLGGSLGFPADMTMVWGDFNGDGFGDLAAEAVNRNVSHDQSKSAVLVLYGSSSGLSATNFTLLVVDDGLKPDPVSNPGCGSLGGRFCATSIGHVGLAVGDLDDDQRDELLIGAAACVEVDDEGDPLAGGPEGCVAVVPGTSPALTHSGWRGLRGDTGGSVGFGAALTVGDFNGDGSKDVAVGAPNDELGETVGGLRGPRAGSVTIFWGPSACCIRFPTLITQNDESGSQAAEENDRFGAAVAANDFDGDGFSDLAVGSPGESSGNNVGHGLITVFFGTADGLPGPRAPSATLGSFGTVLVTNGAALGSSLSAWNFGSGALPDLAIGSPGFTIRPSSGPDLQGAGGVLVLYEAQSGGQFTGVQLWTQDPGFPVCSGPPTCLRTSATARAGNHFGAATY